jgi:hypothetical protein
MIKITFISPNAPSGIIHIWTEEIRVVTIYADVAAIAKNTDILLVGKSSACTGDLHDFLRKTGCGPFTFKLAIPLKDRGLRQFVFF